jgi:predicted RNA-binding protein YlqC (UPF0109 family)
MAAADDQRLLAHILSIPGLRMAGGPAPAAPVAAPASAVEQPPAKRAPKRKAGQAVEESAAVAQPQAAPPLAPPMLCVQEPVTETLECPTACVGYVIGKGGVNVKGVQQVTGAAVQVAKRDEGDGGGDSGTREITVTGAPVAVSLARSMLEQIIAQAQKRSLGPHGAEQQQQQQQQATREERIAVDAGKAGWLIGPGGANIKAIRLLSGARVDVLDEVTHTGARRSTAVVSGTEQQLADARLALQGLIGAVNSVASKHYAEQLVSAAKQRSDILAVQAAPLPVSEGAAAGDASEPAQGGGDARQEAGWVRMTAKHPDGKEVAFWHHPESGMISW